MAVPEQTPFIEYTANGTTTVFPLTFDCDKAEYLIVTLDGNDAAVGSWSFINNSVIFNSAPSQGTIVGIKRNTPLERTTNYQLYNNSLHPKPINKDFDLIWWKLQELGLADWILSNRISALKNYVDRKDDELKAYLMEEIRKQGVALDQLDEYYNYLMQRLAQIAVDKGWDASFVVDGNENQHQINDSTIYRCETLGDLKNIKPRKLNHTVHVYRYSSESKYVGGVNYRWEPNSTDTPNGFETIASDMTPTGRWKAMFKNGVINAWSVGYIGDGVTSNHLVHEKVSEFLKNSNESWKLIFSNGTFLFNHKHNRFWLVSNVNYHVKSTATIKGGIAFDDDIIWFASQYDTAKPLKSTSITGSGTFDMSDTGMMATSYKVRVMFYILNPINLLVDGLKFTGGDFSQVFVTSETGYTSDDVLIKNCRFDIPVSASPSSKNDDHTTIYTQATNTVVRNNRFYSSNIRARCISTAIEFHEKAGVFESNSLDDLAVGMYIAPQERIDCSNIRVLNNTCRLSNLFVSFWANGGADRLINDIVIKGNKVKQNLYPDSATLAANGLIVKTEGLRFLSFIHESGFAATNNYVSNGIDVSGNTFEHSLTGTNDQCQLLYLFCNPPENINFNNNTLKVNAFINSSGLVNSGLDSIVISKNSIDSRYLSTTVAPFSLNISSMSKCYFDMSDIEYLDTTSRAIPMFSFGSSSIPMTLNTIIEGKESRAIYNRSTYPSALFGNANANNVGIVVQTTLTIPSGVAGANMMYTNTSSFDKFSKAEVLYCGVHLDSSIVIPDTLRKRHGDISAFVGVGYTNPALSSASTNDVWLYIS